MKKSILYILSVLGLFACNNELLDESRNNAEEKIEIEFKLKLPVNSARANDNELFLEKECLITKIDVFAFLIDASDNNKEKYDYHSVGKEITWENSMPEELTFKVSLVKSSNNYRFVVIANAANEIDKLVGLTIGKEKDELLQNLLFKHTEEWEKPDESNFTLFPMWGESNITQITDEIKTLTEINLLRMVSRLDIKLSTDNIKSKFTLESVRIYNRKTRGQIVPITTNDYIDISTGQVIKPSIPPDNLPNEDLTIREPSKIYSRTAFSETSIRNIYSFETNAPVSGRAEDATCLIIGGRYKEQDETFYRLDFISSDQTSYKDILRNYLYAINITDVLDSGFSTPEEAFNLQSTNIEGEIIRWSEGYPSDILFFGPFYLSIGKDENNKTITLQSKAGSFNSLPVKTNIELKEFELQFIGRYNGNTHKISNGIENDRFCVKLLTDKQGEITHIRITSKLPYDKANENSNFQQITINAHHFEKTLNIEQLSVNKDEWNDEQEHEFEIPLI